MKKLVYQYFHGASNYHEKSKQSIKKYAESIGADYKFYDKEITLSRYYGTFCPFFTGDYENYDAMCYVDCDVLATTKGEDVFSRLSENIGIHHMITGPCRPGKKEEVSKFVVEMGADDWKDMGHGNAGVVLFPREKYAAFMDHLKELPEHHKIASTRMPNGHLPFGGFDQYILNKFNYFYGTNHLPWEYNYHLSQYVDEQRNEAQLIHYHGSHKNLLQEDWDTADWILK